MDETRFGTFIDRETFQGKEILIFPVVSIGIVDDTRLLEHVKVDHEARSWIFAHSETSFCSYCYNRRGCSLAYGIFPSGCFSLFKRFFCAPLRVGVAKFLATDEISNGKRIRTVPDISKLLRLSIPLLSTLNSWWHQTINHSDSRKEFFPRFLSFSSFGKFLFDKWSSFVLRCSIICEKSWNQYKIRDY